MGYGAVYEWMTKRKKKTEKGIGGGERTEKLLININV